MTERARTVLEHHQVRKNKKQKNAFIAYVGQVAREKGYACRLESGSFGARNIVVGNPATARVIYTAHYDTCAVMPVPNFITPRHFGIYLLYQLALVALIALPLYALVFLFALAAKALSISPDWIYSLTQLLHLALWIGAMALLLAGPANKHTVNDNTSGVCTLLDILDKLPDSLRSEVAFVFFDLEEAGLIGSASFHGVHKTSMQNKLLLNFDCVSDGEHILFAVKKKAALYAPLLKEIFASNNEVSVQVLTKGVFYPSDQSQFPLGVGVAAFKKTRHLNILYMDRIHTRRDTVYRAENVAFLSDGAVKLAKALSSIEYKP